MLYFYSGLRSRYHYGVSWYKSLGSIQWHPLMSCKYLSTAALLPRESLSKNDLERDLISLMDKELLNIPFEHEGKIRGRSTFGRNEAQAEWDYKIYCGLAFSDGLLYDAVSENDVGRYDRENAREKFLMLRLETVRDACGELSFDDVYWKRRKTKLSLEAT